MKAPTPAQLLKQQKLLDLLYEIDGRNDSKHPFHMTYSGLGIKYPESFEIMNGDWANG